MTPSLDSLKLAVAKMLPEHIEITPPEDTWGSVPLLRWIVGDGRGFEAEITDREWLHVCWLAEQGLYEEGRFSYYAEVLDRICDGYNPVRASADHRRKALCRVKCPEMFEPQPAKGHE